MMNIAARAAAVMSTLMSPPIRALVLICSPCADAEVPLDWRRSQIEATITMCVCVRLRGD